MFSSDITFPLPFIIFPVVSMLSCFDCLPVWCLEITVKDSVILYTLDNASQHRGSYKQ